MNTFRQNDACRSLSSPNDVTLSSGELAAKLAALAHPTRLEIVSRIAGLGPCCCKDVVACLGFAQSTVSQHLKVLVDAGLLSFANKGQRSCYELNHEALAEVAAVITRFAEACCVPQLKDQ